ncbi:hypothetical protein NDU88_008383 [Pleurodeles waltl]|uniref:Uncharacterized protein n=1 Tax=Pleurodeles waltl TaxID=8319 RepID=A0AAV7PRR8_PLEWA|nr:hypothetical protein NDU88_008383 [Pleurodeles waltl]
MATGRAQEVPDQGWAWVVLLAVVLSQGMTFGFPSCIAVFYTDIQASFQASNSETSWFPSIVTAVLHAGAETLISACSLTNDYTVPCRKHNYDTPWLCMAAKFRGSACYFVYLIQLRIQPLCKHVISLPHSK